MLGNIIVINYFDLNQTRKTENASTRPNFSNGKNR